MFNISGSGLRRERSLREFLIDATMTLSLLFLINRQGPVGDRLKVMKLLFLATYELFRKRWKGFNFAFYRYAYGPFTPQVYETWEDLAWSGLLALEPGPAGRISLTERGQQVAKAFINEVLTQPDNRPFYEVLTRIADTYGALSTSDLLQKVYSRKVVPLGWGEELPIAEVPQGFFLTRVLENGEARRSLIVNEQWLVNFDKARLQALAETVPSLKQTMQWHVPELLRALEEALATAEQGEVVKVKVEDIKKQYDLP